MPPVQTAGATAPASPEAKLKELGLDLPPVSRPLASYAPWTRSGKLVFVSGQVPVRDGKALWSGKVGREVPLAQAQEAARTCVLQALAILKEAAGGLDRVAQILRTTNYVNAAPGFTDIHIVANGASDLFAQVLGERGKHARVSVGLAELPLNVPFELDVVAEVS